MKKRMIMVLMMQVFLFTCLYAQSTEKVLQYRDYIAQTVNKRLTVKGLELKPGLPMKDALKHFKSNGFKLEEEFRKIAPNEYLLIGEFMGRQNVKIYLIPTNKNKDVLGIVGVAFPMVNTFKKLNEDYSLLKSSLSEKYWLSESDESFKSLLVDESSSDVMKLYALGHGEANFQSRFQVTNDEGALMMGYIVLEISHIKSDQLSQCYVSISYHTSDNVVEQLTEGNDDL